MTLYNLLSTWALNQLANAQSEVDMNIFKIAF